ncbi:MAG: response regulator [Desulfobulbaceae bacterium]|nr:response regulator [Desulfobulbaceae bacterium]
MEKARCLYVDDEDVNLITFRAAFGREFDILTASCMDEALDIFQKEQGIGVVVADQRMPEGTGVELLERIFELDPDPARIILTAFLNETDIIDAVNRGRVYNYILKPWNEKELRIMLMRAVEMYALNSENRCLMRELAKHNANLQAVNARLITDMMRREKAEEKIGILSKRVVKLVEDERARVAQDMHDEFGQILPAIRYSLEALKSGIGEGDREHGVLFEDIDVLIDRLGESARRIISELRPETLDFQGLAPAIKASIQGVMARHKDILVDFNVAGMMKELQPNVQIILYRVFQECMNNIVKHSNAGNVTVLLTFCQPSVILVVKDDGKGFDPAEDRLAQSGNGNGMGIGLMIMQERVASVDGTLTIRSADGKGTMVKAEVTV